MPQFDFAHVFMPQFVWLLGVFAVLYFGIVRPTLPKLARTMQAREDKVIGDLNAAQAAHDRADAVVATHAAELSEARNKGREAIATAKTAAAASLDAERKAADTAAEATLGEAQARIATARDAAMTEVEAMASDLTGSLVTRLTGAKVDAAAATRAVRDALAA